LPQSSRVGDHVLPPLPVRQWVFLPQKRLRPFLPRDPSLTGAVLRILLRAIRTLLSKHSPGAPAAAQLAAVSFLHRFGYSLNPHFHFHVVILDVLFSEDATSALPWMGAKYRLRLVRWRRPSEARETTTRATNQDRYLRRLKVRCVMPIACSLRVT
jgi:hypothetical protein